ncbi:uncharacterized protein EI97DRAFT_454883 [Westerdykella ornata]|uniref:Uncharacterized protein n=1 Tax=Westerdykella ornata TaxID=318751 RepID=A0A6A6JTJ1_WESOR|nr:uncharacterized protein EI97DRAFT_454883 [Westerdykella ornata]KAF2279940.1 hypothetical protein EI97DRAFT_454883 [Westerdykella ornata]
MAGNGELRRSLRLAEKNNRHEERKIKKEEVSGDEAEEVVPEIAGEDEEGQAEEMVVKKDEESPAETPADVSHSDRTMGAKMEEKPERAEEIGKGNKLPRRVATKKQKGRFAKKTESTDEDDVEAGKNYLAILKGPFKFEKTGRMKMKEEAVKQGRDLWEKVLLECKLRKQIAKEAAAKARSRQNPATHAHDKLPGGASQFHGFLSLPREVRYLIYGFYLDACDVGGCCSFGQIVLQLLDRYRRDGAGSPVGSYQKSYRKSTNIGTEVKLSDKRAFLILKEVYIKLVEEPHEAQQLEQAVYDECAEYADDYMYFINYRPNWVMRPFHRINQPCQNNFRVTERGNILNDLTPLSLVCREILCEMWEFCQWNKAPIIVDIRQCDFRPLFRLCRTLKRLCGYNITSSMVKIRWEWRSYTSSSPSEGPFPKDFYNLAQLFLMHWLAGFPLWYLPALGSCLLEEHWHSPCSDGLDNEIDPYKSARGITQEYPPKVAVAYWIWVVRHAAALWRIDPAMWDVLTDQYLRHLNYGAHRDHHCIRPFYPPWRLGLGKIENTVGIIATAALRPLPRLEKPPRTFQAVAENFEVRDGRLRYSPAVQFYGRAVYKAVKAKPGRFYSEWEKCWDEESVPDEGII